MNNENPLIITGLKCDNPECDWEDMSIPYSEYPERVNTKCPKCGTIVLTEEEYEECESFMGAAEVAANITDEEIQEILKGLTPEQMDKVLDTYNNLKSKITLIPPRRWQQNG